MLLQVFLKPIREQLLLSREEIGSLFSNIEAIFELNSAFLKVVSLYPLGYCYSTIRRIHTFPHTGLAKASTG